MKNVIFAALQFVLFLLVFLVGSFIPPFHLEYVLLATPGTTRIFIADGLVLMVALFFLILLIQTLRKRIISYGPWTTAAFILATAVGFWMQLGFKSVSR
ncbi:MAG: hypothetical protein WDN23_04995 [Edaphobacter sp.]